MKSVNTLKSKSVPCYGFLSNYDCNLRCKYCFECEKHNEAVTPENAVAFLRFLYDRDYNNSEYKNCPDIEIMGGESFLYPSLLRTVIEEWHALNEKYGLRENRRIRITTNGTIFPYSEAARQLLIDEKDSIHLSFSIDGDKFVHDLNRLYPDGKGSYDDAVKGLKFAQSVLGNDDCGCRSTYNHATVGHMGEGMINLLELGLTHIHIAPVNEENWPEEEAEMLCAQYDKVIDYIIEKGLWERTDLPLEWRDTAPRVISCNRCTKCNKRTILAPDNNIYNCVRLGSESRKLPFGHFDGEKVIIDDKDFMKRYRDVWKYYPYKCLQCGLGARCANCTSQIVLYNPEDFTDYHKHFCKCGWTLAYFSACMELAERVRQEIKRSEKH